MNQLTAMQVFRRVVELGSFSAAARSLRLSNAAVSKNVSELEAHLGVQLLTRTTRNVRPTEAGADYYARCTRILDDIAEADRVAHATSSDPRGRLRVNSPMSFGLLHLAPAIATFMERHAGIQVDLYLDDRVVDMVAGDFDIGLRVSPTLNDSSLIAKKLAPIRRVLCAAPAYLRRHGTPRRLSDLQSHVCLLNSNSLALSEWGFVGPNGPTSHAVPGRYQANSSLALRHALLAGLGLSSIPTFVVASDLRKGKLKEVVLSDAVPETQTLFMVRPPARHPTRKVTAFMDFLAERFTSEPSWDART